MNQNVQSRITRKLKEKNMSVAALERDAGLKTNVARNILVGLSKKPSAHTLNLIAHSLGCSIDYLLGNTSTSYKASFTHLEELDISISNSNLLSQTFNKVLELQNMYNTNFSLELINKLVKEIYLFSSEADMSTPDERFAKWLFDKNKNLETL